MFLYLDSVTVGTQMVPTFMYPFWQGAFINVLPVFLNGTIFPAFPPTLAETIAKITKNSTKNKVLILWHGVETYRNVNFI